MTGAIELGFGAALTLAGAIMAMPVGRKWLSNLLQQEWFLPTSRGPRWIDWHTEFSRKALPLVLPAVLLLVGIVFVVDGGAELAG